LTVLLRVLCLAILLSSCQAPGQTGTAGTTERPDDLIAGRVERVNDGDSGVVATDVSDVEVRLMGVNAPEQDECHYQESSDQLAALILGQLVEMEVIATDQFDRTLAYVWLEDVLVNEKLVRDGFTIATTPPEEGDPHGERLIAAEEAAFLSRSGLWSTTACGSGSIPEIIIDAPGSSFDPSGPDEEVLDDEWVALRSTGTAEVGGWTIRDESSQHRCHLVPGTVVTEADRLIVTSVDECWDPGGSPVWNNRGDMILVLDDSGTVVARHRYAR
jgi:endonuclease YncB( thermonuclease family)